MKGRRLGIPRALLYYKLGRLWKEAFRALGFEVVTSPQTSEAILKEGLMRSVSDICLPVKAMLGHVENLKDRVDFLFIPRYVSIEKDAYMCPKFIGLPDVVRASFENLPPVIDPVYNFKEGNAERLFFKSLSKALALPVGALKDAFSMAESSTAKTAEPHPGKGRLSIGVVGRPYLVLDEYLSKGIVRSLGELGVNVLYGEPSPTEVAECMDSLPKWIYWSMGKETVASAYMYFKDSGVDGIINISNATCGPDSFTGEVIKRFNEGRPKPYMSLSMDEHTADAGIQTRLEAFIDMMLLGHGKER